MRLECGPDRQADLRRAEQQPAVNPRLDVGEIGFGGGEQLFA